LQDAEAAAARAVRFCPTFGRAYYEIAACRESRGHYAEALRIVNIATQCAAFPHYCPHACILQYCLETLL
jgi:hypothetical protein